jgi:HEAT repeat protein
MEASRNNVERQIHLLMQGSPEEREEARDFLMRLGNAAVLPLCRALESLAVTSRFHFEPLSALSGSPLASEWRDRLVDPAPAARREAAEALGDLNDAAALPLLCSLLWDVDVEVRRSAVAALGKHRDPRSIPALTQALRDPDWEVPCLAVEALGQIGSPALPVLVSGLEAEFYRVRRRAARELGRLRCSHAVPDLCEALQDEDAAVRHAAALALGQIGKPSAAPNLCAALGDGHPDVWAAAMGALVCLGEPAIPFLQKALEAAGGEKRRRAAITLGRLAECCPPQALWPVVPVLRRLRWTVLDGKDPLREALQKIEDAAANANLPLPASGPEPSARGLPVPARSPSPDPDGLPVPSDGPSLPPSGPG